MDTQRHVVVDGFVLRRAESDLWETTPRCKDRRFLVGTGNEIGLAPQGARAGDEVVVVLGCEVPVVLRRVEGADGEGERWLNLEDAYVHGFMAGEAVEGLESGKYELRLYEIC